MRLFGGALCALFFLFSHGPFFTHLPLAYYGSGRSIISVGIKKYTTQIADYTEVRSKFLVILSFVDILI